MKAATGLKPTSYDHRHTAFEVVEYAIYWFAIISVALDSHVLNLRSSPAKTTYSMIAVAFFLVVVRNYIVMQSIDKNETSRFESYHFVEVQRGIWIFFERFVRLALIAIVVLAPKSFPVLMRPMGFVGHRLEESVAWAGNNLGLLSVRPPIDAVLHDNLLYYAAVLFTIAFLSVAWDLVAVASYRLGQISDDDKTRLSSNPDVNVADLRIGNEVFRSLLMYLNTYRVRSDRAFFSIPRYAWFIALLQRGSAFRVYLLSWKFFERCLVGAFSLCLVLAAVSNMSGPVDMVLGAILVAYGFVAFQNQNYLNDIGNFLIFPLWYFVRRQSVEAPLLPKPAGVEVDGPEPAAG